LQRRWRFLATTGLAIAIIAGAIFLLDPFAAPTALDANGERVQLGPIETPGSAPRVGSPAPNFVLADYEGNAVRLEDFRGKVVFLNFWATWCTACEAEMPDMNRLARQHPDELVVLAVNRGEGRNKAKKWSDARNLDNIFFVVDPKESISGTYRLPNSMPVSFYVDAEGVVSRVTPSAQNLQVMELYFQEARSRSETSYAQP
jgi:thiol-disulfide isomerase/thioredoxin